MTADAASSGRDWWVAIGMATAAGSAAVASFSGLRGLAEAAGWPPRLAWLLPITIDAYAMTSARVWLAASIRSAGARRFARANAIGAIAASTTGNAIYHAIGAGLLTVGWLVVVIVGAVPATVLGLTAHLHALRGRTAQTAPAEVTPEPGTEVRTESRTETSTPTHPPTPTRTRTRRRQRRPRTESELIASARTADARHRAEHGRPITRDALRAALHVSGARATELRRSLIAGQPATEITTIEIPD